MVQGTKVLFDHEQGSSHRRTAVLSTNRRPAQVRWIFAGMTGTGFDYAHTYEDWRVVRQHPDRRHACRPQPAPVAGFCRGGPARAGRGHWRQHRSLQRDRCTREQAIPYADPERLVYLIGNARRDVVERRGASLSRLRRLARPGDELEDLAAFDSQLMSLAGADETERIGTEFVSAVAFALGVAPTDAPSGPKKTTWQSRRW